MAGLASRFQTLHPRPGVSPQSGIPDRQGGPHASLIPNRIVRPAVVLPILLGFLLAFAAGPAAAQERPAFRDHAALTKAVQALAGANKTLVRVESIGKTRGGRDLWAIEIAGPGAVPPGKRPALLVAAGFEGDDLTGTELALAVAEHLAKNAAGDPAVKERLETSTVYVLPRINPDGAEGFFAPLKTGQRTNANPFDDDNDGRVDEDGPEDLNGDGFITAMRVPAAGGEYVADPEEPRLMKRADPKKGETGAFRLFAEGIDNDGDGFVNEDPPGGVDIGRNFAHEYPYYKPGAGPHMVSEAESRALMAWIVAHRNVAAILTFGESDNLIVPPTSAGRLGPARELDLVRFAEAAAAGARAAGFIQTGGAMGFGRGGRMMMGEFSMEMLTGGRLRPPTGGPSVAGRRVVPVHDARPQAGDHGRDGRLRLLQSRERQVHRADRDPPASLRPRTPGRLLPVRVLPIRRPLVLDARLRPDDGRTVRSAPHGHGPTRRGRVGAAGPGRPGRLDRTAAVRRRGRGRGHDRRRLGRARGDDDDADGTGRGHGRLRTGPGRGCGGRRDARHRQTGPQVAGRREDRRLRQVDEGETPRIRGGRDRRLQALRHHQSPGGQAAPSSAPPTPSSPCTSCRSSRG